MDKPGEGAAMVNDLPVNPIQPDWIAYYCLAKPGVDQDYQTDWAATRYFVGGKMFAMVGGDKYGKPILTVKLEPAFSQLLRARYTGVVPGYYMNKVHWSSVYLAGRVPESIVQDMLNNAYQIVRAALSLKIRKTFDKT